METSVSELLPVWLDEFLFGDVVYNADAGAQLDSPLGKPCPVESNQDHRVKHSAQAPPPRFAAR